MSYSLKFVLYSGGWIFTFKLVVLLVGDDVYPVIFVLYLSQISLLVRKNSLKQGGIFTPCVVSRRRPTPPCSIWFISIPSPCWSDWIIPIEFPHFVNSCSSMRLGFDILWGILQKYSLIGDREGVYTATLCILRGIILYSPPGAPLSYSYSYKDPVQTTQT